MGKPGHIHALVSTGGHGFQERPFFEMFDSFNGLSYEAVVFPEASEKLNPEAAEPYDALVFYDMWQEISETGQSAFIDLLQSGKGVVFLHHSILSYPGWDEYPSIVGGYYYAKPQIRDGIEIPAGTFDNDVQLTVNIAGPSHPVTSGLQDFEIVEETYNNFWIDQNVHPLLTTEHPASGPIVGWAHHYGNSRIVYIQLGHDSRAYENASYRRVVIQAIEWVARCSD